MQHESYFDFLKARILPARINLYLSFTLLEDDVKTTEDNQWGSNQQVGADGFPKEDVAKQGSPDDEGVEHGGYYHGGGYAIGKGDERVSCDADQAQYKQQHQMVHGGRNPLTGGNAHEDLRDGLLMGSGQVSNG